jgi:Family of unknown function (DUF6932)
LIPPFRIDGYLPSGIYLCTEADATFRFGGGSRRRRQLIARLRRWVELTRRVGAQRLIVDGSFVTAKLSPADIDAVVLLPPQFNELLHNADDAAIELEEMLLTRRPEELFAAEDESDFGEWVEFFSRTREEDDRRKGLVEIIL